MADPLTLALVALKFVDAISQGSAAKKQAGFQAGITEEQAFRERQITKAEEEDFRKRQSRVFAERRAAFGASGVDPSTGSPLLAVGDFAAETELQALRIRQGGQTRASRLEQQAALTRQAGEAAERRGFFRAGASLLTGFTEPSGFGAT